MWEWDYKETWALKNWCFWTVVLEKTLESPLDCKESQPVHPEGNQSWIFIGRTDAEAETPILGLPDVKNWLIWKDPDAGKDWRQEEKGMTEDEMVTMGMLWVSSGSSDGQRSLVCCSPWGCKELDTIEQLNCVVGILKYIYFGYLNTLLDICFENMFSHSVGCLFLLLMVSFALQKCSSLM